MHALKVYSHLVFYLPILNSSPYRFGYFTSFYGSSLYTAINIL